MNLSANIAIVSVVSVFITACTPAQEKPATNSGLVSVANPASEYCVSLGGTVEIRKDSTGNESGICHLPDGTSIDEWELFRRDNPQSEK